MERENGKRVSLPVDGREQLQLLMDSVRDYAIFLTDIRGCIVRWTPGVRSILGYEEAEFVGQNVAVIFTPEDRERGEPEREMREATLHGRAEDERWHLRKDGSRFFASGTLTALRDRDGALRGYSKILRDTTEKKQAEQTLQTLHRQISEVLESISDAFYAVDAQWRFTYVNRNTERLWGMGRDEVLGHNLWEVFPRSAGSALHQAMLRAMDEREASQMEYWSPVLSAWLEVNLYPSGEGLSVYFRDITQRKRAEEALQVSEERFRLLVEGVREYAVVMLDPGGNIVTWNSGAERIVGIAAGEVLGRHFSLFYTPEDRERGVPERLLREARERGRVETEGERVRTDGSRIWVSSALTALRDAAGDLRGYSGISRDITEKKRAEEKLAELAAIVASSSDAIIGKTLEGIITSWNAGAERLYGYKAEEVVGKSIALLIPEDHSDDLFQILARIRRGERVEHYETVRRRKNGTLLNISLTVSPVKDAAGRITGASVIARDITERKQIEAERAAQSERNRRIAETLQRSMLSAPARGAFPELDVETLYQPALNEAAVGGDFFDAFSVGGGRVALVVGDVSGKGLAAAERTSQVKYALRAFVQEYPFPARALARVNRFLYDSSSDEDRFAFIAVSLAVVDTASGRATFALAGAEPPLVLHSGGRGSQMVQAGGLPLGIDPDADYVAEVIELGVGDTLLMFTDGLTEAHTPRGPLLEHEGLLRLAEEARLSTPELTEMGETIVDAARVFSGGSFRDDVCLLLARRVES